MSSNSRSTRSSILLRRASVLALSFIVLLSAPAGALSKSDSKKAVARVEKVWGECFALVGATTKGAKVKATSTKVTHRPIDSADHKPALVTLASGEQFVVHLHPGLTGAATFGAKAEALLDAAAAKGGNC